MNEVESIGEAGMSRSITDQPRPLETDLSLVPDELRDPPTSPVLPPPGPSADLLPFDQRSPEDFEKICLAVAENVDGLRDCRLYGLRGQSQDGIDIVGSDDDGRSVVYQVKHYQAFKKRDLEDAVGRFAKGRRPFRPHRLVICVSSLVQRTEILEALARLDRECDFEVALYDQRRLSEMLRSRFDLVRRLFSLAWARVITGEEELAEPERQAIDVLADAILRTPIRALGLDTMLEEADGCMTSAPARAAELLGEVNTALESAGFAGFANGIRHRQSELLVAAGDTAAAVELLGALAWRGVAAGKVYGGRETTGRLRAIANESGAEAALALVAVFEAIEQWHAQPGDVLHMLKGPALELVVSGHPLAEQVTLWLAETAVAGRNTELLLEMSPVLREIADRRSAPHLDDEVAVRLRLCLAELLDDWDDLLRQSRHGELGSRGAALVFSRHARHAAWHSRPELADGSYRQSILQACMAHLHGEAANSLRSLWRVLVTYTQPSEDWFAATRLSTDVDASGTGDFFERGYDPYDAGMTAMARGELPEALRWLRQSLRDSVIAGHFDDELRAHEALAELFSKSGEPAVALHHAVQGISSDLVKQLLPARSYLLVSDHVAAPAPWERALGLLCVALEADLVPDDDVGALAEQALAATEGSIQSPAGPQVWVNAWKVIAELAPRMNVSRAAEALDRLEPHIARESGTHRWNDDDHVKIVAAISTMQPKLRARANEHLLALLAYDDHLAETVRVEAGEALRLSRTEVVPELCRIAEAGNAVALRILLDLGERHPLLVEKAQSQVVEELALSRPATGTFSLGTSLPRTAYLARVLDEDTRSTLARHAATVVEDSSLPESNRTDAATAISALAGELPPVVRDELFTRCLRIAREPGLKSTIDAQLRAGLHPLSTFRINLEFGSLAPAAIRAAAALARDQSQFREVVAIAIPMLAANAESAAEAAHALSYLPPEQLTIDLRVLASLPNPWARQLAAIAWTRRPEDAPELGEALARDQAPSVRRSLASALSASRQVDPDCEAACAELLSRDVCWSVRKLITSDAQTG